MNLQVIALLGRKDEPTDAVEEYCRYLGCALEPHEIELKIRRVPWELHGWSDSLHALQLQAANWRGTWVFVQYTALAWSARGFPGHFLRVLKLLKSFGARVGVVYHDVEPYSSPRPIDQLRRLVQTRVMRRALKQADLAILTVAPEKLTWLEHAPSNAVFIPVGPNLPFPGAQTQPQPSEISTIGVFSITGGQQGTAETQAILRAVRDTSERIGPLRLRVFGRHAELREAPLRQGLNGLPVDVGVEGVLNPEQVVARFADCDVLLFVRKGISTRRSSAIAGIAAGLPIVAYSDPETAAPLTDAGVVLVEPTKPEKLSEALIQVLTDAPLRAALSERSRIAYQEHFAWPAIAGKFAGFLRQR